MTTSATLRIGTRGSDLARWQAMRVQALLAARGVSAEPVTIRTSGDEGSRVRPAPGTTGKGLFTKEIEDALLEGRVDLAVHSLKDLGAELPAGLTIAAYPEREDPRDALVSTKGGAVSDLPRGARVGTSSLRRRAALLAARSDLVVVALRGNVPTRVKQVGRGGLDAAVLALAGLKRLGLAERAVPLSLDWFPPAPGQGALALEARADDPAVLELLGPLDQPAVRCAVEAERTALAELEGGCQAAIGGFCEYGRDGLVLNVRVFSPDGTKHLSARGPVDPGDPAKSGRMVARDLLLQGARDLIRAADAFAAEHGMGREEA
ncbi:MAG: hydroxymethylbilane synthase [Gemmatimonadetes bacterium]|nr:hydroxymethylbilane synthase [Gemmatimonadota bacterium]